MRYSPCGQRVAAGEVAHKITFFDVAKKAVLTHHWTQHASSITSLVFNKTGRFMASASLDSKVL